MTALAFQKQFEELLPQLKEVAGYAFRRRNPQDREEAIADVCAAAWSAWHGLIKRGRNPLEVGPYGVLANAIRYVRNGRRVGNRGCGRGRMDPWNWRAQKAHGFTLVSLASARQEGDLKAWVANDHRSTPADHACFLIDFEDWLGRLSNDAACRPSCCPRDSAPTRLPSRSELRQPRSVDESHTSRASLMPRPVRPPRSFMAHRLILWSRCRSIE